MTKNRFIPKWYTMMQTYFLIYFLEKVEYVFNGSPSTSKLFLYLMSELIFNELNNFTVSWSWLHNKHRFGWYSRRLIWYSHPSASSNNEVMTEWTFADDDNAYFLSFMRSYRCSTSFGIQIYSINTWRGNVAVEKQIEDDTIH